MSPAKPLDESLQLLATNWIGLVEPVSLDVGDELVESVRQLVDRREIPLIRIRHCLESSVAMTSSLHGLEIVSSQIVVGDLDVAKRHLQIRVAEQAHDCWQAKAISDQLGCVGVPQAMRMNVVRNP